MLRSSSTQYPVRRRKTSRGFTLPELLSVFVIVALMGTFVVAIIAPILKAPAGEQSKVDTLQAASQGLYQLGRDVRMSDVTGVYSCSGSGSYTCSQPTSSTTTNVIVVATPLSSGNLQWNLSAGPTQGKPAWQGAIVYWLVPNSAGSNDLVRAVEGTGVTGALGAGPLGSGFATTAATAAATAVGGTATTVAHNVNQISISINTSTDVIGLTLVAKSTNGSSTNSTTYASNTYARN